MITYMQNTFSGAALVLAVLLAFSPAANAGTSSSLIERILIYDGGMLVYVYPAGELSNPASCHTSAYYKFSMTRPLAKEYLGALLSAQARGAVVSIWGKGSCDDQSHAETLDYFRIEN